MKKFLTTVICALLTLNIAIPADAAFTTGKNLVWSRGAEAITSPSAETFSSLAQKTVSKFLPMKECQLIQSNQDGFRNGFGFPRSEHRLKNTGEVRGIMVFLEFLDIKGDDNPSTEGLKFTTNFEKFYENVSYGKLKFKVDIHPKYVSVNKNSSEYGMNLWGKGNPIQYFKDGLTYSDNFVDYTNYDFAVFIPPSKISSIVYGPSFPLNPSAAYWGATSEKVIYNGVVGGSDQRNREGTQWIWLAHEIGHTLGMEHQYTNRLNPVWDLMDNVYVDTAPELLSWHRFLQGWFDESQIKCSDKEAIKREKMPIGISPLIEKGPQTKAVVIKISNESAIVLESRVRGGFDKIEKSNEGILVYSINVNKESNQEAIKILTSTKPSFSKEGKLVGTLKLGESVKTEGLKITNKSRNKNTFLVSIS